MARVARQDTGTVTRSVETLTRHGQRWYQAAVATFVIGRPLLVDVTGMMAGAEYDRLLDAVLAAPVLDVSGELRYLVTVARRG